MATTPFTKFTPKGKLISSARAEGNGGPRIRAFAPQKPWNSSRHINKGGSARGIQGHPRLPPLQRAQMERDPVQRDANQHAPDVSPVAAASEATPAVFSHLQHLTASGRWEQAADHLPELVSPRWPAVAPAPAAEESEVTPILPRIKRIGKRSAFNKGLDLFGADGQPPAAMEQQHREGLSPTWDRRASPTWDRRVSPAWGGLGFCYDLTSDRAELEQQGWEEAVGEPKASSQCTYPTRIPLRMIVHTCPYYGTTHSARLCKHARTIVVHLDKHTMPL